MEAKVTGEHKNELDRDDPPERPDRGYHLSPWTFNYSLTASEWIVDIHTPSKMDETISHWKIRLIKKANAGRDAARKKTRRRRMGISEHTAHTESVISIKLSLLF